MRANWGKKRNLIFMVLGSARAKNFFIFKLLAGFPEKRWFLFWRSLLIRTQRLLRHQNAFSRCVSTSHQKSRNQSMAREAAHLSITLEAGLNFLLLLWNASKGHKDWTLRPVDSTSERSSRRLARRLFPLFRRAIERFFPRIFPPAAAGIRKLYYFICCWQGNPYPQGYVPRRQEKIRKRTCAGPHYVHHLPRTVRNRENDVNNLKTDGTKEEM